MRITTLLTAAIALGLLASCKKNDSKKTFQKGPLRKTVIRTVHTGTSPDWSDTTNYSYDTQDRVTLVTEGKTRSVYTYDAAGNYMQDIYTRDTLRVHLTVFVAGSNIDSLVQTDGQKITYTEKYVYNAGMVTSITTYQYASTGSAAFSDRLVFTWDNNGNITRQEDDGVNGQALSVYNFTYQHNPSQYSNAYLGYIYISPTSNDLLSTATDLSGSGAVS